MLGTDLCILSTCSDWPLQSRKTRVAVSLSTALLLLQSVSLTTMSTPWEMAPQLADEKARNWLHWQNSTAAASIWSFMPLGLPAQTNLPFSYFTTYAPPRRRNTPDSDDAQGQVRVCVM